MSCKMRRFAVRSTFWILTSFFTSSWSAFGAVNITSIDFKGTADPSELVIQGDGPLTLEKQENIQDNQVVLEFKNALLSKGNARKIDTSSFNSKVSLISPYQVEGKENVVRVVVQLRNPGNADITQEGNQVKLKIANSDSNPIDPKSQAAGPGPDSVQADAGDKSLAPAPFVPSSQDKPNSPKTALDEFVDNRSQQKFSGKPVNLQVKDAEVTDVLRLIGEASGFNIVVGDDVKGKLTLSLAEVPWDQALDVILHTLHLGAERHQNILRVVTLASLTSEKQEELKATQAAEASAPRVTRVFPISYATLNDLQTILVKFAAGMTRSGLTLTGGAGGTNIQVDSRTNSIVVSDLPENIERMKKLIEILDTQTPQVMIEAKIIEATEGFSKSLSGNLGVGNSSNPSSAIASFNGGNPVDPLLGSPGIFTDGKSAGGSSANQGTLGISPTLSFIPGVGRLNALLNWGETESQLKVVSSPKTVVMNKQKATISQGTPVLVPGTSFVAGVGVVPTTSIQSAMLSLVATPTVTNDGSVLMTLILSKDVPVNLTGGQGIGTRTINTSVLVESGSTLVIGGIYTMQTSKTSSGFPFLRKLPVIGALFGNESESTDRSELFIFITPRILNSKEAGLHNS